MSIFKLAGMLFIVPSTVLITACYFVLFANSRTDNKVLKLFGWAVALLLCLSAFTVFNAGKWVSENAREKLTGKGGIYISVGRRMAIKENCPGKRLKPVLPVSAKKPTVPKGAKTN